MGLSGLLHAAILPLYGCRSLGLGPPGGRPNGDQTHGVATAKQSTIKKNDKEVRMTKICVALPLTALMLLAGCASTQRPLPVVKSSADYYWAAENYTAAAADYKEYVDRRPDDVPMRLALAKTLLLLDQPKEARIHAEVLHDLRPYSDEFADLLALTLYESKDRDALLSFCQKRVSERGRVADYLRLGTYSAKLGNVDEARVALSTAARIDNGVAVAPQIALADFYRQLNDPANEVRRLKMALYIDPSNRTVLQRLEDLGETAGATAAIRPDEVP